MRNLIFTKMIVLFALSFFLSSNLFASQFVLSNDGLIDERAVGKIEEIGQEAKSKLGVNIYVYAKESLGLKDGISTKDKIEFIKNQEKELIKVLKKPYVVLTLAVEDTHVNLIVSSQLKKIVDKDEILNGYVVPLLASKDKNTLFAKVSAAVLNGYAAIADTIAKDKNIKLKSSIGSSGKVAGSIWKVFMYTLIVFGLFIYIYAILKRRK
ncbi:hypothetical protein CPU12_03465 [Malaciobacter molluscorum LMG 25693]|uniref:Membrane protein n=1 Tax=Malaciobacter molluscorum LMG 25693 TaxID=870501 RepID=A0A2G1DKE8_9BACT|nr:hypothetical protein [Malaciobacter molluscorum]AXX91316.1 putative membrane protein [Malaciobacter molluscorum LMG 25693]PHO18930.1 hypothetical protein CPU12_03465 [Malaciobacter molluscorum LMG 25693]